MLSSAVLWTNVLFIFSDQQNNSPSIISTTILDLSHSSIITAFSVFNIIQYCH